MTHKEMHKLMDTIIEEVTLTRDQGQKEYAHDEDNVFANFDRVANQTNTDRKFVLWIYLMKHIDGIASYLKGHRSQREEVQGRLTDAIVYLCILWGMIENPNYPGKSKYYVNSQEKK